MGKEIKGSINVSPEDALGSFLYRFSTGTEVVFPDPQSGDVYEVRISTERIDPNVGIINARFDDTIVSYDIGRHSRKVFSRQGESGQRMLSALRLLMYVSDGNEVEEDSSTRSHWPVNDKDVWEPKIWKWGEQAKAYRESVYPTVIDAISSRLEQDRLPMVFVDLFGGDGEFASKLETVVQRSGDQFHVIDFSEESLEVAQKRSHKKSNSAIFVHSPVDLIDTNDIFDGVYHPDIVTALGGLCSSVVYQSEAFGIAKKVFRDIRPGGLFFVTGYSWLLLNSRMFASIGFNVEQMSVPKNLAFNEHPGQLYVLSKPK